MELYVFVYILEHMYEYGPFQYTVTLLITPIKAYTWTPWNIKLDNHRNKNRPKQQSEDRNPLFDFVCDLQLQPATAWHNKQVLQTFVYVLCCSIVLIHTTETYSSSDIICKSSCRVTYTCNYNYNYSYYFLQKSNNYNCDSNKSIKKMQQFHKSITWRLCVAQHILGASHPIIRSIQLH